MRPPRRAPYARRESSTRNAPGFAIRIAQSTAACNRGLRAVRPGEAEELYRNCAGLPDARSGERCKLPGAGPRRDHDLDDQPRDRGARRIPGDNDGGGQ